MSWEADDTSVRVALRIRPQLANEKIDMCRTCTHVPPGEAMVTLGKDKSFTYDYVFDTNSYQERIYEACIQPLIEGCFEGYNATVLAYGQTGAGKTYTMGTGFDVSISAEEQGVIPRAVEHLFQGIGERRKAALERGDPPPEFKINAQFMELYNEDIIDLFDPSKEHGKKSHIKIHEDATGGIYTVGVTTRAVSSKEEIIQCLKMGALSRTTASTNMNAQSSRSHAIFTIHIKQQRVVRGSAPVGEEEKDDTDKETDTAALNDFETLTAKFHFVDLAGSERLKRTGATGDRQKEGISINCGLLALGNVISALGDPKKKGSHVPYRDSKLTRLLQDSLGGNSRTLMIACVSPSDRDFMETLNTLKYANRARNIKNKVSVNQDKTSKIIQELRAKVMELETELLEYRQGRRTIGEDGVECINDMFHENTMLQTENNQLRMRIKAIQETVESQAARISQLMTDQARWQIHQAGEDGEDQVGSMIQGYMKEIEELRGKLIESESMVTHLQRRLSNQGLALSTSLSSRSPSHIALTGGLDSSDLTNQFGGGSPVSPIAEDTESIISLAKKDLQNLKHKKNRVRKRHNSESSDKENRSDGEEDQEEEGEKNGMGEESEEEEDDEEDENQEGEEEEENSESSSDEEEDDNLEEDLADISCEIAIKQKLIDELEVSQKKMQVLKFQYEEKLMTLHQKIQATQQERDKVLANMESVDHIAEEKAKKVKSEYERKLKHMQDEVKKLQAAKREHARLMRNNAQYEKQLKTLRHDLDEMKKTKVRLMKQMRDEQAKSRESENKRTRELAQLKKEQRRRDNVIQQLEREKKQRELVLKRKQEEVNSLRKQARPVSGKVGDSRKKTPTDPPSTNGHAEGKPELAPKPRPRTAPSARTAASSSKSSQSKPSSSAIEKPGAIRGSHIPAPTSTPRRVKHQRRQSSEKMAKMKWQSLEKRVGEVIARRQTINHMERDMERWLQEREKLGKRIERIKQKRNKAVEESRDPKALQELQDQITVLTDNIDNVNDNIMESQNSIMQMSEEGDPVDITAVINSCSIEEARYLLEHFLNMVITKGMYAAQKETECKEREAKVHTLEHSYNMTQDLLQHLIQGQAEYDPELEEVLGNSMAAVAPSNSSSAASTRSASPVDEAEDKVTDLAEIGSRLAAMEAQQKKEKARRRTATPSDLLFADSSDSSSDIASCDIVKPSPTTLIPLPEQKDESSNQENVDVVDAAKLMPPPPAPPSKPPVSSQSTGGLRRSKSGSSLPTTQVNSASDKRSTTPSMRRKTYTKPPAPISMSRTNSTSDTGSDMTITPPGSPTSQRPPGQNVFARLSAPSNSPHKLDKGSINPYNSRSSSRSSPLTCMHLAEGHTKAVLSVDATDDLLFSASKDRTVKVWNLVTGQEIMTLPGHPNNVVGVRYCSYTGLVFSVSTYFVKVWDIRSSSAKCVKTLTSAGQVVTSAASSTTTRTLSMPAGETQINDIRLNRSGSRLYAAAGNTIRVWDLNKFQTVGKLSGGHSAAVMVMATEDQEHDTPIVVSGSKDHYIKQFHPIEFPRSFMEVFEVPENLTGSVSAKYNLEPPHYDGIQSLAIRGDFLFSGSRDTCIKKWDLANQQLRQSISNAHKDWVCALDFVPGRQMLLSGCRAGQLKVWQMEDCSLVGEVKGHDSPINAICSNSSHIFTASSDRNVRIWRPQTTLDGQNSDNTDTNDEGHASI